MRTVPILLVLGILGAGAAAVQLGACGASTGTKAAGEECHASSECGPSLVCDFSRSPPSCASMGAPPADASLDANKLAPDARPMPDAKPMTPDAHVDASVDATVDATVDAPP